MKRFTFELEAVRRLREQEELEIQQELAAALRERGALAAELAAAETAEHDLNEYFRNHRLSTLQMQLQSHHSEFARRRITDATVALHYKDEAVDRIRERLTVASARRTALDRLRERRMDEHRAAELAHEQAAIDEMATMRASRPDGQPMPSLVAGEIAA